MLALLTLLSFVQPDTTDFTPAWSKEVIWYQIFPDRFNNGDPSNDPTMEDIVGAWPEDYTSPFRIHPWTSDWYELQPHEKQNGKDIWYNLQRRRYGGDIQGIIDKLDYLQDLGVTALYLNPVFWSPSLHKYDAKTYHHIDPNFGPDPLGDRVLIEKENPLDPNTWVWTSADLLALKLIEEVHKRNMYIIFDGVFNHMGIESFAFKDVEENQQASPYKDWFMVDSWRDKEAGTEFKYKGWFGVPTLPEIKEDEKGIVSGPKEYIFAATQRWMNPQQVGTEKGIDGWRLDVAFCVAHPFWKDWRNWVKSINPNAYLTAELVDPAEGAKPYLQGDEFDAVMNYNFAFAIHDFFVQDEKAISVSVFDKRLKDLRLAFVPGVTYNMQNLVDSHDTNRIGSALTNPDKKVFSEWGDYFQWSQKNNNPTFNTRKPSPEQVDKQRLIAAFQMTYVGAPMVYYGDECGMWGANDPDCRKPMVWDELVYKDEIHNPDQSQHSPDPVSFNHDLFRWYRRLIAIRREYAPLRTGNFNALVTDDAAQLYVFERVLDDNRIIVVLNRSDKPIEFQHVSMKKGKWLSLLDNKAFAGKETIPALGVQIYAK